VSVAGVAGVVLAAGASTRLGRPKQDVVLGRETLLERAVRVAGEAGLSPVIVVVREAKYLQPLEQRGAVVLLNPKAHEGMAASIRCGVAWAKANGAHGVVLMTCDQPGLRPEHLRALAAEQAITTGSAYEGRVGVPAYFPAAAFDLLLSLEGDRGARDLLQDAASIPQRALNVDVDTEEDFRVAQILFEK
jgi:molybdenum cofactor cytidylyltransferase